MTALANESSSPEDALARAVKDVCETLGWPVGHAYIRPTADAPLRPLGAPFVHSPDYESVAKVTHPFSTEGPDLAARVEQSGQPQWAADISRTDSSQAAEAKQANVRGALSFPVLGGDGEVLGVLQFLSGERATPDRYLLDVMAGLGRQLGIVIERNRALQELEHANAELSRSNRELEQFAYVASHDLQEPLRKIVGFSDLILDRYGHVLDGEAKEFFGFVTDGARRMRQLIEDLLAYSRIGRRQPAREPVPLDDVVDDVIEDLAGTIDETGATVEIDRPLPIVVGDTQLLREVFQNLLSNALKYRRETPPVVQVSAYQDGGWDEIVVTDNGIGIDPQYAERVFEIFQRLHLRDQYPGTGIGLAIARKIVDHHGGKIWVEPSESPGSEFHVRLPRIDGDA